MLSSEGHLPLPAILLAASAFNSYLFRAAAKEFCQFETFNASCPVNQVILMQEARYGRLELGRCVTRDYGFLGCSADVLDLLDRSCSGQRACHFGVQKLRDLVQPCPRDLTAYLEATYRCLTDYSSLQCNVTISSTSSSSTSSSSFSSFSSSPHSSSSSPSYVSPSSTSYALGLSSPDAFSLLLNDPLPQPPNSCRLVFTVRPGQRVRLTLYNLGQYQGYEAAAAPAPASGSPSAAVVPRPSCLVRPGHGRVNDGVDDARRNCQLRRREQLLMTTNGTQATLLLGNGFQAMAANGRKWNHLMKLEATGCPDVRPIPSDSWIERFDDRLVIHCNRTKETWYLTCKGTRWIGLVTNCSTDTLRDWEIDASRLKAFPFGVMAATVIGILLGIILGILLLFLLIYRRRRKRRLTKCLKSTVLLGSDEADYLDVDESSLGVPRTPFQPRVNRYKAPLDQATVDWLCLVPSPSVKVQLSGSPPPQLLEMRCGGRIDEDFEATFVTRSNSTNASDVDEDSQSYAVCLRRTCGSHAHPSDMTSACGSHAHPCLSPTSRSSQEYAGFIHTPCVSHCPTPYDVRLGTCLGSKARGKHARPRLATPCLSHPHVPPLVPRSQSRHAHPSSHAHTGSTSASFLGPKQRSSATPPSNHAHPGIVPAPSSIPAPTTTNSTVSKSLLGARYSGPNTLGANSQQNEEPIAFASSPSVERSHQEPKASQTVNTGVVAMASPPTGDGCPDLVQNSSLTK